MRRRQLRRCGQWQLVTPPGLVELSHVVLLRTTRTCATDPVWLAELTLPLSRLPVSLSYCNSARSFGPQSCEKKWRTWPAVNNWCSFFLMHQAVMIRRLEKWVSRARAMIYGCHFEYGEGAGEQQPRSSPSKTTFWSHRQ